MPLPIHDRFTRKVVNAILKEIQTVADGLPPTSALSRFLRDIDAYGSTDFYAADDPRHRRSPDDSICCEGTRFPAIVIETAYSQSEKRLRRVADDWIMLSNGNVKMVIGLEMSYQPSTTTSSETQVDQILVWEPVLKQELHHDVLISQCTLQKVCCSIIRKKDETVRRLRIMLTSQTLSHRPGTVASTDALTIPVRALAPRFTLDQYEVPEHQRSWNAVSVPFSTLALILDQCQRAFERHRARQGQEDLLSAHNLKRRWSSSSEEQSTEEDEDCWRQRGARGHVVFVGFSKGLEGGRRVIAAHMIT